MDVHELNICSTHPVTENKSATAMERTSNLEKNRDGAGNGSPRNVQGDSGAPGAAPATPAAAPGPVAAPPARKRSPVRRIILFTILGIAVVAAAIYGYNMFTFGQTHSTTDDAQIDGHISPVLPRVSGYVTSVMVDDNQRIKDGQIVVEVDAREFEVKVANAEAALASAQAAVRTAEAGLSNVQAALAVAQSNVSTADVARAKTASDLQRDQKLVAGGAITRQQFDATKAAADAAAAQWETARRQATAAQAQVAVAQSQVAAARTQVAQRQADVDLARLQLSYTKIPAPTSGVVSKKNVEVGQFVQAGQPLMAIAEDSLIWVTANFKETDLKDIKPGEEAEITVDGFPDETFQGTVESIAGATGAKFALLPPDNATGNFVKVTQRVPVKIALRDNPAIRRLRPGMSADVVITTSATR
jgi:membrane fusion protein (multidrug efflux system)